MIDIAHDGRAVVAVRSSQDSASTARKVLVHGAWLGELVELRIDESDGKRSAQLPRVVKVLEASSYRVKAACPHYGLKPGKCGGCSWMFVDNEAQREVKQKWLDSLASLLAQNQPETIQATEFLGKQLPVLGYRNRVTLHTNGDYVGFLSVASKSVAPINDCLVANDAVREHIKTVAQSHPDKVVKKQVKASGEKTLSIHVDDQMRSSSLGVGNDRMFRQANDAANHLMRNKVAEWISTVTAAIQHAESSENLAGVDVIELFSGSGNFTSAYALAARSIDAVEYDQKALDALRLNLASCGSQQNSRNASANALNPYKTNGASKSGLELRTHTCDLLNATACRRLAKKLSAADLLILDPPRGGFPELPGFINSLLRKPRYVIYISCHMASFKRDVSALQQLGFTVAELAAVDQFPQTPHLELMGFFKLGKKSPIKEALVQADRSGLKANGPKRRLKR